MNAYNNYSSPHLWHHVDAHSPTLEYDGTAQALHWDPAKPVLGGLDFCNLVDMLQRDGSNKGMAGLAGASPPALGSRRYFGGIEDEPGRVWRANVKGKGAVGADGDAARHRRACDEVGCPRIELL